MSLLLILSGFNFVCVKLNNFLFFNFFFMDSISFYLNLLNLIILLTFFLFYISFLNMIILSTLFLIMFLMFSSTSLIMLYVFFELSIIPIFMIIIFQGKQFERKGASLFLFFFTLVSSFPMLVNILILKKFYLNNMSEENYSISFLHLEFLFLFVAFMVKLPVYFFHMWLPKAHVEAPIYGSMVLAGVMLKLGGFGMIKIIFFMLKLWKKINLYVMSIFSIGMVISSIYCLFLSDIKMIIAVSSVSHMTFFLVSLSSNMKESLDGGILLLLSHGFLSPLMFYISYVLYLRVKTRSIMISNSYFSFLYPMLLITACSANFCIPPSLNFFSEVIMSMSLISFSKIMILHLFIYMFISTCYSMYLYISLSSHNHMWFNFEELNLSEYMTSVIYFVYVYLSFIFMNSIIL